MPAVLSPSTIATTFVSIDEGADADIVVRRDRGEFLRRWAFNLVCIALLVAILPMFVVIWRREPAYFTNGVVITMLILAVAILVLGVLGAYLWSKSKAGRQRFDVPFLHLNAEGLTVRVDESEQTVPWNRVIAMRLVGADDRSLAITADAPATAATSDDSVTDADPEPPATPVEDYSDYTPPDVDWQPSRADFDAIGSDSDAGGDIEVSGQETDDAPTKREPRADRWRQALYGTPYVVQMRGCKPPLSEIRPIVHNLSRGRVSIPEVSDGVLTKRWRAIRAKRTPKS
ncbi:hypothetical protein CLV47_102159 [Antricoccus suffuscus]|uniref:Uncharacterized protein n=1 Tax=Antricoccus suffuscus TaxID=1629062 RepID=A0A2T1A4E7_9ACTN|nr:hypothetical protein [Antricoccus suffuscus]PRZ43473.1 hypothetical protein CLV47_102159 [Antricoccus suffuscus]